MQKLSIKRTAMPAIMCSAALFASFNAEAEIYASGQTLQSIRESGLRVFVDDGVSDGCWRNPQSAENKAISLLNQYGLYNQNSDKVLNVHGGGHGENDYCIVSFEIRIYLNIPLVGLLVFGEIGGWRAGREVSDDIRSKVEDFIEQLAAKLANEGL